VARWSGYDLVDGRRDVLAAAAARRYDLARRPRQRYDVDKRRSDTEDVTAITSTQLALEADRFDANCGWHVSFVMS